MTFEAIEAQGVEAFLGQIADELVQRSYNAAAGSEAGDSEGWGQGPAFFRFQLSATGWRKGALKLILEPIFEAGFHLWSFGYRPKWTAREAVDRVARATFSTRREFTTSTCAAISTMSGDDRLLAKVAQRGDDADVMHLLKIMPGSLAGAYAGAFLVQRWGDFAAAQQHPWTSPRLTWMLEMAREATRWRQVHLRRIRAGSC